MESSQEQSAREMIMFRSHNECTGIHLINPLEVYFRRLFGEVLDRERERVVGVNVTQQLFLLI